MPICIPDPATAQFAARFPDPVPRSRSSRRAFLLLLLSARAPNARLDPGHGADDILAAYAFFASNRYRRGGEGVDADARKVDGDDETFPEIIAFADPGC